MYTYHKTIVSKCLETNVSKYLVTSVVKCLFKSVWTLIYCNQHNVNIL